MDTTTKTKIGSVVLSSLPEPAEESNPRDRALLSPPVEEVIPTYLEAEAKPRFMSVEADSGLMEDVMIRTFIDVMKNANRYSDRRAAAADVKDLLGKSGGGKSQTPAIYGQNVQVNQLAGNPDLANYLKGTAEGLKKVVESKDSNVSQRLGGAGV